MLLDETWHEARACSTGRAACCASCPSRPGNRGRALPSREMGERLVLATIAERGPRLLRARRRRPMALARAARRTSRTRRVVSAPAPSPQQLVEAARSRGRPHPRGLGREAALAARARRTSEEVLSKDAILEAYMNRLSYGRGLVGPRAAAARGYFGGAPGDLSLGARGLPRGACRGPVVPRSVHAPGARARSASAPSLQALHDERRARSPPRSLAPSPSRSCTAARTGRSWRRTSSRCCAAAARATTPARRS